MNALSLAVFAVVLAMASAHAIGVIAHGVHHGAGLQGPGSHTAIIGPDGSHIDAGTHGGGVGAHGAHGGIVAAGLGGWAGGVGWAGAGLAGAGHEGQYVPSGNELHYDDGSYRGEHHWAGGDHWDGGDQWDGGDHWDGGDDYDDGHWH